MRPPSGDAPTLSIVAPAFNEEHNLHPLVDRLTQILTTLGETYELVLVNDGSRDQTLAVLRDLAARDPHVRYVSLSRNFGHEMALTAGIEHARGQAVVLIDADLQDPPELIASMVARWRAGVHVVYAQRTQREGETLAKLITAKLFYLLISRVSDVPIPRDTGVFRLMDRRVVDELLRCRENPRFTRGLVSWVGFTQECVPYRRKPRHAGKSGYNYKRMLRLAADAICSFSLTPLWLAIWLGLAVTGLAILGALVIAGEKLLFSSPAPRGIPLLTCAMFFLGGIQLFVLGMIGMYVGQIFRNVQNRPMYVVAESNIAPAPVAVPAPEAATPVLS